MNNGMTFLAKTHYLIGIIVITIIDMVDPWGYYFIPVGFALALSFFVLQYLLLFPISPYQ
jgi:hypothetical protein